MAGTKTHFRSHDEFVLHMLYRMMKIRADRYKIIHDNRIKIRFPYFVPVCVFYDRLMKINIQLVCDLYHQGFTKISFIDKGFQSCISLFKSLKTGNYKFCDQYIFLFGVKIQKIYL